MEKGLFRFCIFALALSCGAAVPAAGDSRKCKKADGLFVPGDSNNPYDSTFNKCMLKAWSGETKWETKMAVLAPSGEASRCETVAKLGVEPFAEEMQCLFDQVNFDAYFRTLRFEAMSRVLDTYKSLVGRDIGADAPASCAGYSISKRKSSVPDDKTVFKMATGKSAEAVKYRSDMKFWAQAVSNKSFLARLDHKELEQLKDSGDCKICGLSVACSPPIGYQPACKAQIERLQSQIDSYTKEIFSVFRSYPYLPVSHDASKAAYDSYPTSENFAVYSDADVVSALTLPGSEKRSTYLGLSTETVVLPSIVDRVKSDLLQAMDRLCKEPLPWRDLIRLPDLARPLGDIAMFKTVQKCADESNTETTNGREFFRTFISTGSCIGAFVPFLAPALGAMCVFGGAAVSYQQFSRAADDVVRCKELMTSSLCTAEHAVAAVGAYEKAKGNLIVSATYVGLTGASLAMALAPSIKSPDALNSYQKAVQAAASASQGERVALITEAAGKAGISTSVVYRTLEGIDTAAANKYSGKVAEAMKARHAEMKKTLPYGDALDNIELVAPGTTPKGTGKLALNKEQMDEFKLLTDQIETQAGALKPQDPKLKSMREIVEELLNGCL